jgi:hypothetical protein
VARLYQGIHFPSFQKVVGPLAYFPPPLCFSELACPQLPRNCKKLVCHFSSFVIVIPASAMAQVVFLLWIRALPFQCSHLSKVRYEINLLVSRMFVFLWCLLLVVENSEELSSTLYVQVSKSIENLGSLVKHLLPRISQWGELAIDALVFTGFCFRSLMLDVHKSCQVCSTIGIAIAELRRCRGECTWRHPIGIDIFRNFEAPEEDWGYVPDLASENSADSSTSIELDCLHTESDLERKSE